MHFGCYALWVVVNSDILYFGYLEYSAVDSTAVVILYLAINQSFYLYGTCTAYINQSALQPNNKYKITI